ncbi:PHP domain-containing protein [Mucilaginibacter mali]|uniref:PHP domain-containing protein n=1 Tax=Mucilaginibacter mali TaxID=2740462 RepID=A0A7D4TMR8_9SPHI|nr:CehA/McbA family metallohydrolase [Mucilaginibacter mali]QKJ29374.1 PHP domain-containing protein [Mucilaginibacter mali]
MYKNIRIAFSLLAIIGISNIVSAQDLKPAQYLPKNHVNPWIKPLGALPPIASLTDGVWLKGDLHVHSSHSSEGGYDPKRHPVKDIIAFAKSVGFGYIAITDHDNHVLGDVEHNTWADPDFKSDSVLLLYGAEWTTTRGHGNTFSAKPYDHQKFYDVRDQRDANILAVKKELGIHLSANHPAGPKDHFGFSYDMVDAMEVWNSCLWTKNANSNLIWEDMLASGRRVTARGGSDVHRPSDVNYIGTPTTWVFAAKRNAQGVVDGLVNGRVSVSANPFAPRVEFYADINEDGKMDMMMGDNAKSTGKPIKFRVELKGNVKKDSTYTINVIKDGRKFGSYKMAGSNPVVEFTDTPRLVERMYYRLIVEGPATDYPQVPRSAAVTGNMVALSNPIYFNFDPKF